MGYGLLYQLWVQFTPRTKTCDSPKVGYWLVALRKGCPLVGSVRGWLGVRLTIRSPKVGLESYMGYRLLYQFWGQLTYRQSAQNAVLTDQICRDIYCIHLSIVHMQIAIFIT